MHLGEAFNFGGDFSFLPEVDFLAATSSGDEAIEYDNMPCYFSVESIVSLGSKDMTHCHQKKHAKNRTNYRDSVLTSCWYIKY